MGCVLVIDRRYFLEIGGFDEGMDVWGGENIELPVRVSITRLMMMMVWRNF